MIRLKDIVTILTQKNQETTLFWQEMTINLFFRINYKTANIRECYNMRSKFAMKVIPNPRLPLLK